MNSMNLQFDQPIRILVTGINVNTRRRLMKHKAYNWLMSFSMKKLEEATQPEGVVYITPEAEDVLDEFDPE